MRSKNKGKCIIIFGLSGAGKSSISKLIHKQIEKKIGKTVLLDGNEIRDLFRAIGKNYGFEKKERSKTAVPVLELLNIFLNQNINVLYNNVGLNKIAYQVWKKGIKNLIYVYIKADVKKIIKYGKKKEVYNLKKNVVGLHIKPDIPKKPNIIIENNFDRSLNTISKELLKKLKKEL
jgi:cytidine diphosphoramidate kinase|tara:strand:- start:80 stop:607 length:528 start_codon:yes stop_codon:yes gene_type:complete